MSPPGKSLREQLAPLSAKLREGRAIIRPVSQVMLTLKASLKSDQFEFVVHEILRWMDNRAGRSLPSTAWQYKSFDLADVGAQRTAAIAIENPKYWSARLDDADKQVPLRTWVTEIGVAIAENNDILFGARLICASRGEDKPFDRSVPGFVRGILSRCQAELDGDLVSTTPRLIKSEQDVEWLISLLERPTRRCDVIVLSLTEGSEDPQQTAISAEEICQKVLGTAHVLIITSQASYSLTNRVGRELSVFRQGVRTYKPGFRSWVDEPARHPLALPQRISNWTQDGTNNFTQWLVNQTLASTVYVADRDERLPSFNTVRQYSAQRERERLREAGSSDAELMVLYKDDNDKLRNELKEQKDQYDGLLLAADQERRHAEEAERHVKSEIIGLRSRIRILEQLLSTNEDRPTTALPNSLESFEDWCRENLSGTVMVANRA